MKIFVSKNFFPNRTKIFDSTNQGKISFEDPLQLVFIDGKITFKVFKTLYTLNLDAYFVVQNLEYFLYKMKSFRNLNFVIVENSKQLVTCTDENVNRIFGIKERFEINPLVIDRVKEYKKIEEDIRRKYKRHNSSKNEDNKIHLKTSRIRTKSMENIDNSNVMEDEKKNDSLQNQSIKGVEISFRPRIFDSIKTSLSNPGLYLSGEMNCHKIFRILSENDMTLDEIKLKIDENIENTLKSMIFTKIIEMKGDKFVLNSKFKVN